jgi:hypothetical protein
MKFHHTAALTLIGWYLMAAPVAEHGGAIDQDAPLSQWKKVEHFDLQSDCDAQRQEEIHNSQDAAAVAPPSIGDDRSVDDNPRAEDVKEDTANALDRAVTSRCVADNDPKLGGKSLPEMLGPGLMKRMLH